MRWKGRILSLAVALVLLLGTVPVFATDAESAALGQSGGLINPAGIIDITPPALTSISIDKTAVEAPGIVTVTAEAWDDISGIDYITVWFDRPDKDSEHLISLNYESGQYVGTFEIGEYHEPCLYEVVLVWLKDNSGNTRMLKKNPSQYEIALGYEDLTYDISFSVENNGTIDSIPPQLINISFETEIISAPGILIANTSASDDVSGVSHVDVWLENQSAGTEIYFRIYDDAGELKQSVDIDRYKQPGLYECTQAWVTDYAGNTQRYKKGVSDWDISNGTLELPPINNVTIINDLMSDSTPPVLESLSFSKATIEAPGAFIATARTSDDLSGASYISAWYENDVGDEVYFRIDDNDGEFEAIVDIGIYQRPGLYQCAQIWITDYAENTQYYTRNRTQWHIDRGHLDIPDFVPDITIINENDYTYTTNTNNPNLADEIAALPDGSTVGIDYGSNPHIGADVFEAIQGKDIDVVLVGDGIEWVFNGQDIDNPKSLDLSVAIEPIDYFWSGNAAEIKEELQDTPAVVLSFKPNGDLPGKATIRVKADSEFRDYLGVDDLYVYYYNTQKNELELVKADANVSSDGFIEFCITHNSEFVITAGKVSGGNGGGTEPPTEPVDPPVNPPVDPTDPTEPGGDTTPPINPTYPSSGSRSGSSRSSSGGSSRTYNFDKRDVTTSAKVNRSEIEVTGQTQLGFYQAIYMGTKIEGVTTRTTDTGVVVVLPQEFVDSLQSKQWKKVRIEFFNAYVDVDYGTIKKVDE